MALDKQLAKLVGPYRVFPGRLSVSRTIGDAEAKLIKYGGNPKVVIGTPDVFSFDLGPEHDFIFLGCDGIFDRLSNEDICETAWSVFEKPNENETLHKLCGEAVEQVIRTALARKTLDNVTGVLIAFDPLAKFLAKPASASVAAIPQNSYNTVDVIPHPTQHFARVSLVPSTPKRPFVPHTPRSTSESKEIPALTGRKSATKIQASAQKTYDHSKKSSPISTKGQPQSFMLQTFHNGMALKPIATKKLIPSVVIRKKHQI